MISAAPTPPMGWNSWDCFGTGVTEDEVLANARWMAEHLQPYGWNTIVVDIQWYEPETQSHGYRPVSDPVLDGFGRQLPAPNRFPSSVGGLGFTPLVDEVHRLGLRFGIHVMRGIPRKAVALRTPIPGSSLHADDIAVEADACSWNPDNVGLDFDQEAAQLWVDAQVAQFAAWGVDFIKVDDILWPFHERDLLAYRTAIERSGRPIVLSLSPGRQLSSSQAPVLIEQAEMWRISDDLWDDWNDILEQFHRAARWAPFAGEGHWPDLDMLPLGRIGIRAERGEDRLSRLSLEEQRTMLTLWCLVRSPLMFGGHLPDTPAETLELLRSERVLALLNDSRGAAEVMRDRGMIAWSAAGAGEFGRYAAMFWTGVEASPEWRMPVADLGLAVDDVLTDLWTGEPVVIEPALPSPVIRVSLPAHGTLLIGAARRADAS